jgi:hypothetical protein
MVRILFRIIGAVFLKGAISLYHLLGVARVTQKIMGFLKSQLALQKKCMISNV